MKLQNGAKITVTTELDPASFLANFDEIRDNLWDAIEESLPKTPTEESKGNILNFEGGSREQWLRITDRITGFVKKYHLCDAEVDNNGLIHLTLNRGNGASDTVVFPFATEYSRYANFNYFLEVAPTREEIENAH